jgi:hypothetical protein
MKNWLVARPLINIAFKLKPKVDNPNLFLLLDLYLIWKLVNKNNFIF